MSNSPAPVTPEGNGFAGKRTTLRDVPTDLILDLAKQYAQVAVTIQRRNNRGQMASLGYTGITMETADVVNIAEWIKPRAGGGTYVVEVIDRSDGRTRLMPMFEVAIEGQVRPAIPLNSHLGAPVGGFAPPFQPFMAPGAVMPQPVPVQPVVPVPVVTAQDEEAREAFGRTPRVVGVVPAPRMDSPWLKGLDPMQQYGYVQHAAMGYPGMTPAQSTIPTEQFAAEQLRKAEATVAALTAKFDNLVQRSEERERQYEKLIRDAETKHREQLFALQIEHVKAGQANSNQSFASIAAALAPFAPVAAAYFTSGRDSAAKSMEVQQAGMSKVMELAVAQANRPAQDPTAMIEKFLPILLPLMTQDRSASNIALFEAMSSMQMNQMALVAQMAETLAQQGPQDSPLMAVIQNIMGNVGGLVNGWRADQQRAQLAAPPQMPVRAIAQSTPVQQPVAQPAPQPGTSGVAYQSGEPPRAPAPQAPMAPLPPTSSGGLNPAMLNLLPTEFRTPEWKRIIMALHTHEPSHKVGSMFAMHVGHLVHFDMLPQALSPILVDPHETLKLMLQQFPIYTQDQGYCEEVIEAAIQGLLHLGIIESAEDEPEVDSEEAEESEEGDEADEEGDEDAGEDEDEALDVAGGA